MATVPRMKMTAPGMAIQAMMTRPAETMAPALVPGTGRLPKASFWGSEDWRRLTLSNIRGSLGGRDRVNRGGGGMQIGLGRGCRCGVGQVESKPRVLRSERGYRVAIDRDWVVGVI